MVFLTNNNVNHVGYTKNQLKNFLNWFFLVMT